MREISADNNKSDINGEYYKNNVAPLAYVFWLKVIFGIIGGIFNYVSLRLFYYIGGFHIHFLLRGFLIVGASIIIIVTIQLLIILLLYVSKKKSRKIFPHKGNIWRSSLRYTFLFFVVFIISASISFYIGF